MVIELLGRQRDAGHPAEGGVEIGELEGLDDGVAPLGGGLEEVGPRALDDQHAGVVGREAVLGL